MGSLLVSGISYFVTQVLLDPILSVLAQVLTGMAGLGLTMAKMPWVAQAAAVSATVAGGLLAVQLAVKGLNQYILWNEGASGDVAGNLIKPIFRAAVYAAAGSWLAYTTFRFGIWYAGALLAVPLLGAVQDVSTLNADITQAAGVTVGTLLFFVLALVAMSILLLIVALQMAKRAAELALYIIAAPVVALGWVSDPQGGGVWASWWRGLVVLSLATTVQYACLHGLVASVQPLMATSSFGGSFLVVLFLMIGWCWVAITGPHLMQQWAAHTGVGSALTSGASQVSGNLIGKAMGTK